MWVFNGQSDSVAEGRGRDGEKRGRMEGREGEMVEEGRDGGRDRRKIGRDLARMMIFGDSFTI